MSKRTSFLRAWLAVAAAALSLSHAAGAKADDWPQWQGPDRNAVSQETGLLKEWPKDGPPLAWTAKGLGGGDSAPSVAAGRIYGMSNRGGEEIVWALSEADGKPLWATPLRPAVSQQMPQGKEGPACTPTVDGDRLYAIGLGGDLSCVQATDGKLLWRRSLTEDFGGVVPMWSYRESPLIDGDKVICTPGGADATMVALDKMTGKTIWKTALPGQAENAPGGEAPPARQGSGEGAAGFWSPIRRRLCVGDRDRLRRAAAIRAIHRESAHRSRRVRWKIALALRQAGERAGHQLLHRAVS